MGAIEYKIIENFYTGDPPHPQIESFLMALQVQMLLLLLCISMLYGRLLILELWFEGF